MEKYDIEVDDDDTVRYYKPGTKNFTVLMALLLSTQMGQSTGSLTVLN